jgi:hypothetical protein
MSVRSAGAVAEGRNHEGHEEHEGGSGMEFDELSHRLMNFHVTKIHDGIKQFVP